MTSNEKEFLSCLNSPKHIYNLLLNVEAMVCEDIEETEIFSYLETKYQEMKEFFVARKILDPAVIDSVAADLGYKAFDRSFCGHCWDKELSNDESDVGIFLNALWMVHHLEDINGREILDFIKYNMEFTDEIYDTMEDSLPPEFAAFAV